MTMLKMTKRTKRKRMKKKNTRFQRRRTTTTMKRFTKPKVEEVDPPNLKFPQEAEKVQTKGKYRKTILKKTMKAMKKKCSTDPKVDGVDPPNRNQKQKKQPVLNQKEGRCPLLNRKMLHVQAKFYQECSPMVHLKRASLQLFHVRVQKCLQFSTKPWQPLNHATQN